MRTREGEWERKELKGRSEAAGTRAKGDKVFNSGLHIMIRWILAGPGKRVYIHFTLHAVKGEGGFKSVLLATGHMVS